MQHASVHTSCFSPSPLSSPLCTQSHPWVFDNIMQSDDVRASTQVLQDLYLSLDLLLLHRLSTRHDMTHNTCTMRCTHTDTHRHTNHHKIPRWIASVNLLGNIHVGKSVIRQTVGWYTHVYTCTCTCTMYMYAYMYMYLYCSCIYNLYTHMHVHSVHVDVHV